MLFLCEHGSTLYGENISQLEHAIQVSKLAKRYLCCVNESYDEVKNVVDSNVDFSRYPALLSSYKSAV